MNFKSSLRRNLVIGASMAIASVTATQAMAQATTRVYNANITEAEVLAAQKAWGNALIQISDDYTKSGFEKARTTAAAIIDAAYGYNMGPVLFKPTLTSSPQTFRTTREGALSYFVGGDPKYPKDTGFALKGWKVIPDVSSGKLGSSGNSPGSPLPINSHTHPYFSRTG